ncbi:MAG: hypothetical protein ACKKMW_02460 [Candidatus Nealsonbacteria bacterium]
MREIELIKSASPCDTNYNDKSIQTISDAKKKGRILCSNLKECQEGGIFCTLNLGWRMAQFVIEGEQDLGKTLESESKDFLKEHPKGKFWIKKDDEWSVVEGKSNAIDYIKKFAINVIDEDSSKFKPAKRAIFEKPSDIIINMAEAIDSTIKDLKDMAEEFKE